MQFKRLWSVLAMLCVAAAVSPAFGHPGHGTTEPESALHAAEPVHLLPLTMLAAVIALGGFSVVRRLKQARDRKN
jgi:hydrogenase/urease accessory protein HupE